MGSFPSSGKARFFKLSPYCQYSLSIQEADLCFPNWIRWKTEAPGRSMKLKPSRQLEAWTIPSLTAPQPAATVNLGHPTMLSLNNRQQTPSPGFREFFSVLLTYSNAKYKDNLPILFFLIEPT